MTHAASTTEVKKPLFTNKTYDAIKWVAQYFMPAAATLYGTLGTIWGWPHIEQVIASISAVALFLGVVQGIGAKSYKASDAPFDGDFVVGPTSEGNVMRFEVNHDLESLQKRDTVTFKVKAPDQN